MIDVPAGLRWWRTRPEGAAWLEELPAIVEAALARWSLRLTSIFEAPAMIGFVAAVERQTDRAPAVLKVNPPDRACAREANALAHWDGDGAVALLASEPGDRALLLERCRPGTQLWQVDDDDDATRIAAAMLRRIWRPPPASHGFDLLAEEARRWSEDLPRIYARLGQPIEPRNIDLAVGACRELITDRIDPVVVHQDLHGGNVLRAEREPWLVIDPKPLVGERAFDVASLVRDRRERLVLPGGAAVIARRLDLLADELGLDRERMRRWSLIHALAWGVEDDGSGFHPEHLHVARLLADARTS